MFKKMIKYGALSATLVITGFSLSGCTPGNNTPGATLGGAAIGGLIGSQFGGNGFGMVAGAALGGLLGNQMGQYMDARDRARMNAAIIHTPVGEQASWRGKNDVTYEVRPIKVTRRHGRYCREYQTRIKVGGKWRHAYGKACRMPDGQWKIRS